MEKKLSNPIYPYKPIGSLEVLANVLGIRDIDELLLIKKHSDNFFFVASVIEKRDGTLRNTYDIKHKLKSIHRKIKNVFLKKIYYPEYLQGSLAKRDYLTNANIHTNSKCILTEDIRNFFPSISKDIVVSIWKNIFHFPYDVSETLAELITYKGFLVQGSPVSSYIANLALWYKEPELVNTLSQKDLYILDM